MILDRHMHLFCSGIADGREVNGTLTVNVLDGRMTLFVNGDPLLWATNPAFVSRSCRMIDAFLCLPVETQPVIEEAIKGFGAAIDR